MIETTRIRSTTVIRLAHGKASAFDSELLLALREALVRAAADSGALVLTGSGTIFSAGVDLKRLLAGGPDYLRTFLPAMSACFTALFEFPRPAVAAVNGHAIAGGCLLALACDRRLMARGGGRIGVPELRVGVPFPLVPLEIVRFALAPPVAQEVALLGRTYLPEEALARGLVDDLVPPEELLEAAVAAAEELAAVSPLAFERVKRDLRRPAVERMRSLAAEHDRRTFEAWASADVRDAVRDYVQATLR